MAPIHLQFPQILALLNPDDIKTNETGIETTKQCDQFLFYLFRDDTKELSKFREFLTKQRKEIDRQKGLKRRSIII